MNFKLKAASMFRELPAVLGSTIVVLLACALQGQSSAPNLYTLRGQPHLFGPGVISTPDFEFNASFTPDGKTVYFSKSDPGFNRITIVSSHRKSKHWSKPEVAAFSGIWKDTDPRVSPDGNKLFFTSNRPVDGGHSSKKDYDIWYVERTAVGRWGEPKHLGPPVNSDGNESYASVTRDGTLYFAAARPEHPGTHLYRSRLVDGEYNQPELLLFSTQGNDLDPSIAADESFIIFVSRDRGGLGAGDLYVSFRRPDGTWSAPKNLGAPISSSFHEIATGLSPDNRTLYFASNRIDGPLTRTTRVEYRQLERELRAIQNGLLNIYEVDITDLHRLDDGQ